jgi:hypothetical protein
MGDLLTVCLAPPGLMQNVEIIQVDFCQETEGLGNKGWQLVTGAFNHSMLTWMFSCPLVGKVRVLRDQSLFFSDFYFCCQFSAH